VLKTEISVTRPQCVKCLQRPCSSVSKLLMSIERTFRWEFSFMLRPFGLNAGTHQVSNTGHHLRSSNPKAERINMNENYEPLFRSAVKSQVCVMHKVVCCLVRIEDCVLWMKQNSDKWQKSCMKLGRLFRVIFVVVIVAAAAAVNMSQCFLRYKD
jgi:hypothetical protein